MDSENPVYAELRRQYEPLDAAGERALVEAALAGDALACERLFHSVSAMAVSLLRQHGLEPDGALGEFYLLFLESLRSYDGGRGARFRSWFYTQCYWATRSKRRQAWEEEKRDGEWSEGDEKAPLTARRLEFPELDDVRALFPQQGRERALLDYMAGASGAAKPSLAKLARDWGCSRQNAHALFLRVARRARNHFGALTICECSTSGAQEAL